MKRIINIFFILLLILIVYSCNTRFTIQSYTCVPQSSLIDTCSHLRISNRNNHSITLISDTTLNYSISIGGLSVSTTIGYILSDSILTVDTVDIYHRNSFQEITNDIFGHKFYYFKDSMINTNNHDLYYSGKLIQKEYNPNELPNIYIIVNNKKYKYNLVNRRRLRNIFNSKSYTLKKVCNKEANEIYGVNLKDITFEAIKQ